MSHLLITDPCQLNGAQWVSLSHHGVYGDPRAEPGNLGADPQAPNPCRIRSGTRALPSAKEVMCHVLCPTCLLSAPCPAGFCPSPLVPRTSNLNCPDKQESDLLLPVMF